MVSRYVIPVLRVNTVLSRNVFSCIFNEFHNVCFHIEKKNFPDTAYLELWAQLFKASLA